MSTNESSAQPTTRIKRRLRSLPPLSMSTFVGYLGFVDGRPDTQFSQGGYDADSSAAEIFVNRKDAKKRYEDVRRVRITVEEE
jgi:hypothetical protein